MADPTMSWSDQAGLAAWREAVARVLEGADVATLVSRSADGIAIQPLYPPATTATALLRAAGACRIVQRVDHPDVDLAARQAAAEVEAGSSGLVVSVHGAATARGFGLPAEAAGLARVLAPVDLDRTALRLELPPFADASLPLALARAVSQTRDPRELSLDVGFDPVGDSARTGGAPRGEEALARTTCDALDACRAAGLAGPLLRADGRPHHEAGATQAQELAAIIATGVADLRMLEAMGWPLEAARAALSFVAVVDTDLLLSIAKLRALRRLWAGVEAACGLAPAPLRLHAETAWRDLTRRDPWTNIVRGTLGCSAAILGGADSVTILPFTSALGLPEDTARRLARTTGLVLMEEAHLGRIADPAAGSGALEGLTDGLCAAAWALFQAIDGAGGLPAALAAGWWQDRLASAREARIRAVADGTRPIVGTTVYRDDAERPPPVAMPAAPSTTSPAPGAATMRFPALPSRRDAETAEGAQP